MTCCRDEEDIIETFIRFYLEAGFDAVHVIDNGSTDGTADIVEALAASGLPVSLERDDRLGYERFLTSWFHRTGERLAARWLLFLDSDEFILFRGSAPAYFTTLPAAVNRLRLKQKEVYPVSPTGNADRHFLLSHRIEPTFNDTTKDVVKFHRDARVYAGKHRIDIPHAQTILPEEIFIRHYKYRTPAQAARKEANRLATHRVYSDIDLEAISAFGVQVSRDWVRSCAEAAACERWRESFDPQVAADDDHEMADWAERFLASWWRQQCAVTAGSSRP